ncbi:glycosyltransferase family 2 protein [Flavobacterium sp.]|uniref:glycosyltransferase family 2 protein n=1 Tax=Flavobacterium sp. TaxID=239 RepID=UPI0040331D4C
MQDGVHISIVSPVYMAENIVGKLLLEIQKVMSAIGCSYEIILVDDRSPDNSWLEMNNLSLSYPELINVRLSKNFGEYPAIMAGLSLARGEWVVVMDCDLQDKPSELERLYSMALQGYDIVVGKRAKRKDNYFKKLSSKLFSAVFSYLTSIEYDNERANFGIYNKKVIKAVLNMGDRVKFFPLFILISGFRNTTIPVEHGERFSGKTSYNFKKLMSLAFNILISFSDKPLRFFAKLGMLIIVSAMAIGSYDIYEYLYGSGISGNAAIIDSIWFLSGIIITAIGVTGIYVGKIFEQVKQRPVYIIDEVR